MSISRLVATALFFAASIEAADATKFNCTLSDNAIQMAQCSIESTDVNSKCEYNFGGGLVGTCLSRVIAGNDRIWCVFHVGPFPLNEEALNATSMRLPGAGFTSGAVTDVNASSPVRLIAGYQESAAVPEKDAVCTR